MEHGVHLHVVPHNELVLNASKPQNPVYCMKVGENVLPPGGVMLGLVVILPDPEDVGLVLPPGGDILGLAVLFIDPDIVGLNVPFPPLPGGSGGKSISLVQDTSSNPPFGNVFK